MKVHEGSRSRYRNTSNNFQINEIRDLSLVNLSCSLMRLSQRILCNILYSLSKCNFIQEPDEDLRCAVCSHVAEDPIQHVDCGKLFCKRCLEKHGDDSTCPECKTEGKTFFPDTKSKTAVNILCSPK